LVVREFAFRSGTDDVRAAVLQSLLLQDDRQDLPRADGYVPCVHYDPVDEHGVLLATVTNTPFFLLNIC
jgi:hypothetical protein